ncbi:ATP-dependent RNA helicase DEAH13 isoform X3 [Olea europaea var. sylvestris]|uniref:ATP-dependent RNA helicase DEAH13 isoform X3 n=1 Tax=Olea europaea var. sylvestris TaxID=158386 RepID=UPI000C1D65D2|nr:ATP-dependent RNA helicase DEAH13 isoform X3 [Olea europaea var. sylvestris]XP_022891562.1 ATP-dependent RNA helicase DEAH13 isoform X3 [Olea europaea var. sylvestris]XP_022891563.1 ATP-dependent RNA helicase DEAH13 isoform X3 [Olea europaea var. sylvestris]
MEHVKMDSSTDLNDGTGLLSNAIMLPGKKKNKKNKNKQVSEKLRINNEPKLSKSQKRKLKKLEEEKEKEILLSKSIEELEKYKIQDDVHSLMWSSRNLGQVETVREKRRRQMQFARAGLELDDYRPFKKRTSDDASGDVELHPDDNKSKVNNDNNSPQPFLSERELQNHMPAPLKSSEELVSRNEPATLGEDAALTGEDVNSETNKSLIPEQPENSKCTFPPSEEPAVSLVYSHTAPVDGSPNVNLSNIMNQGIRTPLRTTSAPTVVHVSRSKEVESNRRNLPIVMMEQEIMEAINENNSVIICGETGCGKTTQVPQFLYETGFGSSLCDVRGGVIGVTQPRRVAVLATAKRVAYELGLRLGKEVGFQVRHDRRIGENCSIKFMTDGILLREVQNDFWLRRYSIIILDEAHERSLNTDILIGMLSRVIRERQWEYEMQQKRILAGEIINSEKRIYPLKLVLMSATLCVEDFVSNKKIFHNPPPVIEVPTRQYPVTMHFSKRTEIIDYVGQAYKKVLSIHKRLPPGGILVFVTGQREVEYLCKKLRNASQEIVKSALEVNEESSLVSEEKPLEENDIKDISEAFELQGNTGHDIMNRFGSHTEDHGDLSEVESDVSYDSGDDSDLEFYSDEGDVLKPTSLESDSNLADVLGDEGSLASLKASFEALAGKKTPNPVSEVPVNPEGTSKQTSSILGQQNREGKCLCAGPMRILPLYAMLPASAQLRVFEEVKEGERLVVVATNVAETSLTIPGIKYVVDTGREKVKNYDSSNGMETYEIQWISKASAAQRAGRAGRTGPGHCYRLYSSAVFNDIFLEFSCAEILKVPVDGVVLLMKSMHIGKVKNFPFPTPPEDSSFDEAELCLKALEALDNEGRLTPLGKAMARYPMSPRHSRMLLTVIQIMREVKDYARANLVLGYAVAAAAALSLSNPFIMLFEASHDDTDDMKQDWSEKIPDEEEKLRKKKLKETAKLSRAKFCNPTSDALTIAYALQCFELSENPVEFCTDNGLHYKTMEEMSKLRKQLLQLVFSSNCSDFQREFSWTHGIMQDVESSWRVTFDKHPLLLNEEEILGQAICAGWADRVAKRIKGAWGLSEGDRKVNAARYQACMVKETVFLHRRSSVSKSPPEFLVYSELLYTKRPYIHGATSVKSNWLVKYARSSCIFSAPLSDPKPYYDPVADQVFSWVAPTFRPHLWPLPLHGLPIKEDAIRVAVFACSLLEGQVLPCLKAVRKFMAASPASILKPEASGLKRVGNLLNKLSTRGRIVDSCAMLKKLWNDDPSELFSEIRDWFQEGFHNQFEELWTQMLREVQLGPKKRFSKRVKGEKRRI